MPQHRALRYMTRFQCLGPQCEASCCASGWTITVDEDHYHKLKEAMRGAADRPRFQRSLRRERGEVASKHRYAVMVLDDNRCGLLDKEGTCSVHRRFGEKLLPDVCATYPRKVSVAREHIELAGALSCPEVARQLYRDADSVTVDPLDPSTLRNRATQRVALDSTDPYDEYFDDVRACTVGLLETPGYPLASRLFFVGWFAEKTRGAFHRGAGEDATSVLEDAIIAIADEDNLARWHKTFAAVEVTSPLAASVISGALKERVEVMTSNEPFRQMVRACYANLGAAGSGDEVTIDARATYDAYVARRDALDSPDVERMLTSYAIDYWLKDYYTFSRDLGVHANKLVLRVALLRFLLFSHPDFDAADPARTLVEVTYKLARAVEHDPDFAKILDTILARLQVTTLAHSIFLMKV